MRFDGASCAAGALLAAHNGVSTHTGRASYWQFKLHASGKFEVMDEPLADGYYCGGQERGARIGFW